MDEDQVINRQEEEPVEVFFKIGDGIISQNELDRLLLSEDSKDKDTLKSTVVLAAINGNYGTINYLLHQGYQLELLNDKNQTITHLVYYTDTDHSSTFWSVGLAFSKYKNTTNYIDSNGLSHLHIACATGYVNDVMRFLDNGEDINGRLISDCDIGRRGFTPLHFAVAHLQLEVVKLLLERGADINAVDSLGYTPLLLNCAASRIFKQSINSENLQETTRWNSELTILTLLLEHKSDLSAKDNNGNTPVLSIYNNNYYNQLCNDKIDDSNPSFDPELVKDLHKRQLEKFMILYQRGVDITVLNYNDENILHCIIGILKFMRFSFLLNIKFLYDEIYARLIQFLLRRNKRLDVNAKSKQDETPLALAVSLMSCKVVKVLLDDGADLNSINIDSYTFFNYPNIMPSMDIVFNLISMIALLVDKGFNLTLEVDIAIMKFLTHDVGDCNCGNVNSIDSLSTTVFSLISHSFSYHLKRVFKILYENSEEESRNYLLSAFQAFIEYCKLIPYSRSLDDEIVQIVYAKDLGDVRSLTQKCSEDVVLIKSTKLKCGVSIYDLLTKYSRKANIFNSFDTDDVAVIMHLDVISGLMVRGHVTKSMVRTYVESSALKNYVSLILPCLPDLCHKMILTYLETEDIFRLCSAALLE